MTRKVSFTALEKELAPEFREKMNHAEGVIDLENFYTHTMLKLVQRALDAPIRLMPDDIQFDPDREEGFRLSKRLRDHPGYRELAAESDIEHILHKFAAAVKSRYRHYRKHPERPMSKAPGA